MNTHDMIKFIDETVKKNSERGLDTKLFVTFDFFGSFYMVTDTNNLSSHDKHITIIEGSKYHSIFRIDIPINDNLKITKTENGFDIFNSDIMENCIHCILIVVTDYTQLY